MDWPGSAATDTRRRLLTAWSRHEATPRRVLVELADDGAEYWVVDDEAVTAPANELDRVAEQIVRERPGLTAKEASARLAGGGRPAEGAVRRTAAERPGDGRPLDP